MNDFVPMLPKEVIDRIFARLQVAYVAAWVRAMEGLVIEKVKDDWQRRLAFVTSSAQVAWALDNLPKDWPPNAMQFAALCRSAPRPEKQLAIEEDYKPQPERVAEVMAKAPIAGSVNGNTWKQRLAARSASGEKLSYYVRTALRQEMNRAARCEATSDMFFGAQP